MVDKNQATASREAVVEQINARIEAWLLANQSPEGGWSRGDLARLVNFVGDELDELLQALCFNFSDIACYRERPAILLGWHPGSKLARSACPVIWLLGWRKSDQTQIHDHVTSQVAVRVWSGEVAECVYRTDVEQYQVMSGEFFSVHITERKLTAGATITIPAPYIHSVGNVDCDSCAVSIHAYYPPLDAMNFFERSGNKQMRYVGSWEDDEASQAPVANPGLSAKIKTSSPKLFRWSHESRARNYRMLSMV